MKLITLLNNIARGKEIPKKIKYQDTQFEYNEEVFDYISYNEGGLNDGRCLAEYISIFDKEQLNDNIEVV